MLELRCHWCRELFTATRSDALYCGQSHRQAAHRFNAGARARARAAAPMTFAYADPPYPGRSSIYRDHPDYAGEVDHAALALELVDGYPDGFALSTAARSLPDVLEHFRGVTGLKVAAWLCRPRPHRAARFPISAWEPVIYRGGRPADPSRRARGHETRFDALYCRAGPRLADPARVVGAKPAEFAFWLFDLLGALPGDTFDDLYPGSGGIGRAWTRYTSLEYSDDGSKGTP